MNVTELKTQLRQFALNYSMIDAVLTQIEMYNKWPASHKDIPKMYNSFFFGLVMFSFYRTVVIETTKLIGVKKDKKDNNGNCRDSNDYISIYKWLKNCREDIELTPSKWNPDTLCCYELTPEQYKEIIDPQIRGIKQQIDFVDKLWMLRDKLFAHADKKYFLTPDNITKELGKNFLGQLRNLLEIVDEIISCHYHLILGESIDVRITAADDIKKVLRELRAWDRVRLNTGLRDKGFRGQLLLDDECCAELLPVDSR